MELIKVKECSYGKFSCPFNYDTIECQALMNENKTSAMSLCDMGEKTDGIPEKCPLREGPITVKLKE